MDASLVRFTGSFAGWTPTKTLVWIGERNHPEFRPAFDFCESRVAQVAFRSDLADALLRPATNVATVVVTRLTREAEQERSINAVRQQYPNATLIQIVGSLCLNPQIDNHPNLHSVRWHQAVSTLPRWLSQFDAGVLDSTSHTISVAIISQSAESAGTLVDLADEIGAVALWCKSPSSRMPRNIQFVWWDDSSIVDFSESSWRKRIRPLAASHTSPAHIWLTNYPIRRHIDQATQAGVQKVIGKPFCIDTLLSEIGVGRAGVSRNDQTHRANNQRRAA